MYKLHNTIQNYAWGSETALTELFGIDNNEHLPMAEVWMGAHPKSSSRIIKKDNLFAPIFSMSSGIVSEDIMSLETLKSYIEKDLVGNLGQKAADKFKELPYLFKVLCAKTPLSIQVHPNKKSAELGFEKENKQGIPLDSPVRDYKDANHKPELIYALTDFIAMNAFRTLEDISQLILPFKDTHALFSNFITQPDEKSLSELFEGLLKLTGDDKFFLLKQLRHHVNLNISALDIFNKNHQLTWQTISTILDIYPEDMGAFSPLLLNVIHLKAGEAMFLYANTPHAYLSGTGLEIMANSDNVLRAGLTSKNINISELMSNLEFIPTALDSLPMKPNKVGIISHFPIPVDDFRFSIYHSKIDSKSSINLEGASIFFCVKGKARIQANDDEITLLPGQSCFVSMKTPHIELEGDCVVAQAFYSL
ncbi:mannose-6-phosphate isomerase, class I [Thorsellia kenyensis]|uniref:mannose-6-phosphate isomerase n=1 Tax=Thorsellia kenyensis TaxID=1549888 RepID=A0ABV6C9Z8_9GAMM